jgi:hypothetical protein
MIQIYLQLCQVFFFYFFLLKSKNDHLCNEIIILKLKTRSQ